MVGTTLLRYEILEEISRGGMGVVYRARDVELGREVALKVLPPDLARRSRAPAALRAGGARAAALNHPHIAAIYEVGEADGVTFIAMELVGGEKLAIALDAQSRCRCSARSSSPPRSPTASRARTTGASSIATSSRPT